MPRRTDLIARRRHYGEPLVAAGHSDVGRVIPMARLIALASTKAEAEAVARRGAQWLVDSYAGPQHPQSHGPMQRTYDGKEPTQHYVDSVILHGTPESVVDQIARLKEEIGLNYLMCAPLSRETFRLLADEVLPRL